MSEKIVVAALYKFVTLADYVALRGTDLQMSKAAGQVIAQVRAEGVPDALPGPAEFDSTAGHLGAAYEAAWLACLVVADLAGEEALVRVYDAGWLGGEPFYAMERVRGTSLDRVVANAEDARARLALLPHVLRQFVSK